MRKHIAVIIILLLAWAFNMKAQTIWDAAHLAEVKTQIQQSVTPAYQCAYRQLLLEADALLTIQPPSVMQKERVAASGDKHDYLSLARYYWPDVTKPNGLPYVNRDGVTNPEIERLDRPRLGKMASGVVTLSLAWYFSGEAKYAQKAVDLLRVWFINKDTFMNPHLNYAQMVPGVNNGKGRCYGLIDAYSFVEMLDAVQLLEASDAFTAKDGKALKEWFSRFLDWMIESEQGKEESSQPNNHSIAYDVQVISYANYIGNQQIRDDFLHRFYEQRMLKQITPDGSQPQELRRTLAFGYSEYNLAHIIDIFQIARHADMSFTFAPYLPLLEKAADFLANYLGKEVKEWPYQQISDWDYKQNELSKDLYRLYLLHPERQDYLKLAKDNLVKRFTDRFFLLYYTPDETDNAFAQADAQLRYLLQQTTLARKDAADKVKLMPRCMEKDGSLRLVGISDWCSGFFPGELWQMWHYSHDPFWREQAVSNTWKLEDLKWNNSSHDLGFMVYNSFGKAYEYSGERSYRDVVIQAAKTLATRFDEKVGCIRSWSWGTPERWKFAVIIDNMMNLELLFQASLLTGDRSFYNMAVSHANQTLKNHFREDNSSYHVVDYNPQDGGVIKRITHQGIADESVWSRGQSWGLYGFIMCYRYTHDERYLEQAKKIAHFFFSQKDLPADLIPYWDMRDPAIATKPNDVPRDASAAAVFASGLYELATYVSEGEAQEYRSWANGILDSLTASYQPQTETAQGFLLLHSTGNYPADDEIDVPIIYADYYYLEALTRRNWK